MASTRARIILAALPMFLGGCGAYLHNSELETATTKVQTDFNALEAPAFMAAQRTELTAFAAREDKAAGELLLARRNAILLAIIRPAPMTAANKRITLDAQVSEELAKLANAPSPADEQILFNISAIFAQARSDRVFAESIVKQDADAYIDYFKTLPAPPPDQAPAKPETVDCDKIAPPPAISTTTNPEMLYESVQRSCAQLALVSTTGPHLKPFNDFIKRAGGDIQAVYNQLELERAARKAAQAEAKAVQVRIQQLTKASEANGQGSDALRKDVEAIGKQLKDAAPWTREAGLEELASIIEDAAAVALKPGEIEAESGSDKARAATALGLLYASADFFATYSAKPDITRGNAALIGLERVRYDLALAKLEVARRDRHIALLEAQLNALFERGYYLVKAKRLLAKHPVKLADGLGDMGSIPDTTARLAASEALANYVAAWDEGEIPYQLLRYRVLQADRSDVLDRATAAEKGYRAILKPAVDQLATYGKGGIKPDTIVNLLGQLGIAAAILGDGK